MALLVPTLRFFSLSVIRSNGDPVAGVRLRVLTGTGVDVTTTLLGVSPALSDASGIFIKPLLGAGPLTAGVYSLQLSLAGYNPVTLTTQNTFTGTGIYTATLSRLATDYELTRLAPNYVSSLYAVEVEASREEGAGGWELIRFQVEHSDNRTATMQIPVDVLTDLARADIHNRIKLPPLPHFVAENAVSLSDPDFSDQITITAESENDEGVAALTGTLSLHAANMVPAGAENDLTDYAEGDASGLLPWITPLAEPILFRGYYLDVMIWLVEVPTVAYVLQTTYYDGAGTVVGPVATANLTKSEKVQRIKLNAEPADFVRRAVLQIKDGATAVSHPLNVRYRD